MSPRNFPEKARKSCLVSNHFPYSGCPLYLFRFSPSNCFIPTHPPPNSTGEERDKIVPGQGPKREVKSQLEDCGPGVAFLLLGASVSPSKKEG